MSYSYTTSGSDDSGFIAHLPYRSMLGATLLNRGERSTERIDRSRLVKFARAFGIYACLLVLLQLQE